MTKHFMCDLETMGTTPGCAIVSIGVIGFNPNAATVDEIFSDHGFYAVVNRESNLSAFLHEDDSTKAWWEKQAKIHPRAAEAVEQYRANKGLNLAPALEEMIDYVAEAASCSAKDALFYGNGADFDNPIIGVAARMVNVPMPWKWGNRCYRTLKNLHELFGVTYTAPKLVRVGQYHNALDDAKSQAMHLWETVRDIKEKN